MNEAVATLKHWPRIRNHARVRVGTGLLLFAATLWICAPLLAIGSLSSGQWYWSQDGMRWPYLLSQFAHAVANGFIYPRWMPTMLGGYGYPSFLFYQPGLFYAALPFYALTHNGVAALAITSILAIWLGGMGAYRLARHWNGRAFSFGCALLYMLTPYAAVNLYTRGDLTEHFAMQLTPWCLHLGLQLMQKAREGKTLGKAIALFVAVTALLVVSHPFVALFFLPFLAAVMLVAGMEGRPSPEALWVGAIALCMAAVASAPYWFTILQMKHHVTYYGEAVPLEHFRIPLAGADALNFQWAMHNWMLLPAAVAAAWNWRMPMVRLAASFTLLYFLMMTEISRPIWEAGDAVLKYVQFSSRLRATLAITELLCIILAGASLKRLYSYLPAAFWLVIACTSAAALGASFGANRMGMTVEALARAVFAEGKDFRLNVNRLAVVNYPNVALSQAEKTDGLFPKAMRRQGLQNRAENNMPIMQMPGWAKDKGKVVMLPKSTPFLPQAEVTITEPAAVLVNQFFLPGWRVEVDRRQVPWDYHAPSAQDIEKTPVTAGIGANGRVRVWFGKPGTYRLKVWYEGPPHWRERNLLMLVSFLVLLAGCYWREGAIRAFRIRKNA